MNRCQVITIYLNENKNDNKKTVVPVEAGPGIMIGCLKWKRKCYGEAVATGNTNTSWDDVNRKCYGEAVPAGNTNTSWDDVNRKCYGEVVAAGNTNTSWDDVSHVKCYGEAVATGNTTTSWDDVSHVTVEMMHSPVKLPLSGPNIPNLKANVNVSGSPSLGTAIPKPLILIATSTVPDLSAGFWHMIMSGLADNTSSTE